ncbi:MAG: hypothetical protein RSA49_01760 [Anaerovoracaceae bacterium]
MIELKYLELKKEYDEFKENYKTRVRSGFICMAVIPLFLLLLMFNLDSKLFLLTAWIASIIIISSYLIWLDYTMKRLSRYFEDTEEPTKDNQNTIETSTEKDQTNE